MKKTLILLIAAMIGITASAQYKAPKIIAHRGFHKSEGAARNSLNALKAAQEAKFWGSECDLQLTKDGEVLVASTNSCIKLTTNDIPVFSRGALGNKSIKLGPLHNVVKISIS